MPDSPQRTLFLELISAARAGLIDSSGAVDVNHLGERFDGELEVRLRESLMDDVPDEHEDVRREEIEGLICRFEKKKTAAETNAVTGRLRDASLDDDFAMLHEKNELLKRKREQLAASARVTTRP